LRTIGKKHLGYNSQDEGQIMLLIWVFLVKLKRVFILVTKVHALK